MAKSFSGNKGIFVPTTNIWDVQRLQNADVNSQEFKELLLRLYQNTNNIANALNLKENGYYSTEEFLTGGRYFPENTSEGSRNEEYRTEYGKLVVFGGLPNASSKSVAHGIDATSGTIKFTNAWGMATDTSTGDARPIPYTSPMFIMVGNPNQNHISLEVDSTNVTIETGIDRTNFDTTFVVLKYLKI